MNTLYKVYHFKQKLLNFWINFQINMVRSHMITHSLRVSELRIDEH